MAKPLHVSMSRNDWIVLVAVGGWLLAPTTVLLISWFGQQESGNAIVGWFAGFPLAFKDIIVAAIGSAAGAWGGAYAAQRISDRAARRKELIEKIHALNVAHSFAAQIFNIAFEIRTSFGQPLYDRFAEARANFEAIEDAKRRGVEPPKPVRVLLNQHIYSADKFSTEALMQHVSQSVKIYGRPLLMTQALASTMGNLRYAIDRRNDWIETTKTKYPNGIPTHLYFGLPAAGDIVDRTYPNLVESILKLSKSAIYFSHTLCTDFTTRALLLAKEFKSSYKPPFPTVAKVDYSQLDEALIPRGDPEYASWETNFPDSEKLT